MLPVIWDGTSSCEVSVMVFHSFRLCLSLHNTISKNYLYMSFFTADFRDGHSGSISKTIFLVPVRRFILKHQRSNPCPLSKAVSISWSLCSLTISHFLIGLCKPLAVAVTRMYLSTTPTGASFHWNTVLHDAVMTWKRFLYFWPFVRGVHRSPIGNPHTKGQ